MIHPIITDLKDAFTNAANPLISEKQKAYMRNQFPFLGIPKPSRDILQKPIFKKHAISSESHLVEILFELWGYEHREYQYSALEIAYQAKKKWSSQMIKVFEHMIRNKSWWDTVDDIAAHLVGSLIFTNPHLSKVMDEWIEDENLWVRRSAILHQLTWKEKTSEERLFKYCQMRMHETDFFIRKAIGWVLRQYSKTNPASVKRFVSQNHHKLSGLSIREASKYI